MTKGDDSGREAGARNLVFLRTKWLQAAMKGTLCVRRLRLRRESVLPWCSATCGCSCVRSYRVLWNLCLQIPV